MAVSAASWTVSTQHRGPVLTSLGYDPILGTQASPYRFYSDACALASPGAADPSWPLLSAPARYRFYVINLPPHSPPHPPFCPAALWPLFVFFPFEAISSDVIATNDGGMD
ncbi:hypothetical protein J6590_038527 [Homalodisca vitripennis]|nr:hypothetical protein J6590_038527 [Homalodisca vitripennis]